MSLQKSIPIPQLSLFHVPAEREDVYKRQMQNYMISCRKKNGVCPTETVEDRAEKDFRSLVRDRGGRKHQRKTSRLMYAMSTCLVLIVLVMGVVTMNNMDKMKAVQSALHEMSGDSEKETKIVKENGKDAVLDGTDTGELTQVSSGRCV